MGSSDHTMRIAKLKVARLKACDKIGGVFMETLELLDILSMSPLSFPDLYYAIESVAASSRATQEHDRTMSQSQFNDLRRHYDSLRECCYVLVEAVERAARSFMTPPVANHSESAIDLLLLDRMDDEDVGTGGTALFLDQMHNEDVDTGGFRAEKALPHDPMYNEDADTDEIAMDSGRDEEDLLLYPMDNKETDEIAMDSVVKEEEEEARFADVKPESSLIPFDPSDYYWEPKEEEEEEEFYEETQQYDSSPFDQEYAIASTSSSREESLPTDAADAAAAAAAAPEKPKSKLLLCSYCTSTFLSEYALKNHERYHTGIRAFKCQRCSKDFIQRKDLQKHYADDHGEHVPVCLIDEDPNCTPPPPPPPPSVPSPIVLSDPIVESRAAKAPVEKEQKCSICSMIFPNNHQLRVHRRTHPRPYACSICNETFLQQSQLTAHFSLRHEGSLNTPDVVASAPDSAPGTSSMDDSEGIERRTSSSPLDPVDPKRFRCSFCTVACTTAYMLRLHERIHTGERPFKCHLCSKTYVQKTHLNAHVLRTHSVIPVRLPCRNCDKTFRRRQEVTNHLLKVHNEKAFKCNKCGDEFDTRKEWNEHLWKC